MRVLIGHNLYRSSAPSGENQLVRAEIDLLRDGGVEVVEMLAHSDDIPLGLRGMALAGPGPIYSRSGVARFKRLLDEHRPDVVHVHNVYPLISPWVLKVAAAQNIPVVQTVHNYRHGCVNGLHLRDGHACTDCLGTRLGLPAIQHGCYRGSRAQTLPMAIGQVVHRRTWLEDVARFLALTPFMRDKLTEAGIPADKITVRPTWVPDPGLQPNPGGDVLFVGRLDEPKGIDRLLDEWAAGGRSSGRRLRVVGDGPLSSSVSAAASKDETIEHVGRLDERGVRQAMTDAAYLAVPSRVFEGYPLVVAEAFGIGRPILTVTGGSVGSIIDDDTGWVVSASRGELASAMTRIQDEDVSRLVPSARARFERENSPEQGLSSLIDTYLSAGA